MVLHRNHRSKSFLFLMQFCCDALLLVTTAIYFDLPSFTVDFLMAIDDGARDLGNAHEEWVVDMKRSET